MSSSPLILNPGPVKVPAFVLEAIGRTVIHQRGPEFSSFFGDLQEGLKYFFQTQNPVAAMPGSGTTGMESAIRSLFQQGQTVLIVCYGKFSRRWAVYARMQGILVVEMNEADGLRPEPSDILQVALKAGKPLSGIVLTHCETSTGAFMDIEGTAFLLRQHFPDTLILVDAITGAGILPFYSDAWDVDIAVAASQKSLLNPAGTVFISVSQSAAAHLDNTITEDAFDLSPYYYSALKNEYPFTPPTQMFFGILAALQRIQSETLPIVWNRSHSLARFFRAGLVDAGYEIFPVHSSDSLTAFSRRNVNMEAVAETLKNDFNIEVAGGQGTLKGKILRVAHFGDIGIQDMKICLDALKSI